MTPETESIERRRLPPGPAAWQQKWYEVIFEADTTAGKAFDVALLLAIVVSILVVMLESVEPLAAKYGQTFDIIEWVITLLFTLEFLARLACVARPSKYALSFFGVVDLVSLLPSYLSIIFVGADSLLIIRTLRLLRIFRVLKLARHVSESRALLLALRHTWPKITVFLLVIFCAILISGTAMYLIERGPESDFENIPISVYWAIVTMTTVGYGDIAPKTELGRFLAALIMLFGYAVIIVPTGIFSAEVMTSNRGRRKACGVCGADELSPHANFCEHCGAQV